MSPKQPSNQIPANGLNKAQLVTLLQQTIAQLDGIVQQLTSDSIETLPSKTTVESLVSAADAIASVLNSPMRSVLPDTKTGEDKNLTPTEPEEEAIEAAKEGIDRVLPSFNRLETWWDGVLAKIRSILPVSLNEKLSDWAITGILTGTVVVVLLTSVLLLPQSPTEIAQKPSETPPELIAPKPPQTVEIAPPPEPELTPEQSLIAAIQQEVTDLTSQYPAGLIASIEANFTGSRLIVTVGDQWYQLNAKRQDAIGNAILKRSQKLDFRKLEMLNPQGTLIARSPVVGDEIIIYSR